MAKKLTIEVEAMVRDYFKALGEFFAMLDGNLFGPLAMGASPTPEQLAKMRALTNTLVAKNKEAAAAMQRLVH